MPPRARKIVEEFNNHVVTTGPTAWTAHVQWVLGLIGALVLLGGVAVTYGAKDGGTGAEIKAINNRIDDLDKTIQSLRTERTALITQRNRENEEIHVDIHELRGEIDRLQDKFSSRGKP